MQQFQQLLLDAVSSAVLPLQQTMQQQSQTLQQTQQTMQQQSQELALLRQASSRPNTITTTLDVAEAALSDLKLIDSLTHGQATVYIDNWTRAVNHLKCGASIKEAFSSTSTVSSDDIRDARLAKVIATAVGASSRPRPGLARSVTDRKCSRCNRPGHRADECYAKTNIKGEPV